MRRVQLEQATGTIESIRGEVAEVLWDTGARSPVPLAWLSDAPGCEECRGPMEAQRSTRKYCSDTCRLRAFRRNAKRGVGRNHGEPENARESAGGNAREALAA